MAVAAAKTKDQAPLAARMAAEQSKRARVNSRSFAGKTFETLMPAEKDKLLKQLAVQAGLIQDSEDE